MRIGFYTPTYPGLTGDGGIGTYTRDLARGLARLGHTVRVLAAGDQPPAADGPVRVTFASLAHLPGADRLVPGAGACWRVGRAMARLARAEKLDVVEFPNWEGLGLAYQRFGPTRTVVRLSTSTAETDEVAGRPPTRLERWDIRRERWQAWRADALVSHSDAHRRRMAAEYRMPADRIGVAPLGVATDPGFVRPPRPAGPPTVVALGRLEPRKGTIDLLRAVPRVLERVPEARFELIGDDRPLAPGGRTHAAYLSAEFPPAVRARVTLAGRLPQPDVDRRLQSADVFALPSVYESFGLAFPEAMRWGTPVVGTTAGGIPEVVRDGHTGLLVAPGRPDDLATAVVRLLADRDLATRLGAAGRCFVETELSIDRMAARAADLYAQVAGRTPAER